MTNLIERIEAATGPDRELFWEAFNAAFPEPAPGCEPVWRPENPKQPIYHAWKTQEVAFRRFVDAEAWEQAALTLVPDGLFPTIDFVTKRVWLRDAKGFDCLNGSAYGFAMSLPNSICAAALRGKGTSYG